MRPYLWLLLASFITTNAMASAIEPTTDQRVGEGIMAVLKGEKQKAWDILFPEAKKGNIIAMYHLGDLMLKSPEYPNNLERAAKFFKAAADRGHKGSAAMLSQVQGMLGQRGQTPTIAGTSGVPVPTDIEGAKQAYARMQSQIGRFVGEQRSVEPVATIKMFITDNAGTAAELVQIANDAKARFGDKVDFQYYVLIDQANWNPRRVFTSAAGNLPLTGFRPDMNGSEARKYGVRSTPAIVLVPQKGQPKILSNAQSVITELSAVLR